jgi:hypothetical protein
LRRGEAGVVEGEEKSRGRARQRKEKMRSEPTEAHRVEARFIPCTHVTRPSRDGYIWLPVRHSPAAQALSAAEAGASA